MNIITVSNEKFMTDEYYIKHPMQMVKLNLVMIIINNSYLIKALVDVLTILWLVDLVCFTLASEECMFSL